MTAARTHVPTEVIASHAVAVDQHGAFPSAAIEALRSDGLLGLSVPERFGGLGASPADMVEVVSAVAGACASTGMVFVMHVTAAATIAAHVDDDEGPLADALREMAAGEHLTTLAYSERGSRGHFWAQLSRAAEGPDGTITLNAEKSWATSAGHADSFLIATGAVGGQAPTDTELYLVPATAAGLSVPTTFDGLGLRGNASAPLSVNGVQVGIDRRVGDPGSGFPVMLGATLPWFVLGSAACSVGIASAAVDAAAEHASRSRLEHLGVSLAELPTVRARLAEAYVALAQTRAYVRQVAQWVTDGAPEAELGVLSVKAAAAEAAVEICDLCLKIGGGAAYSKRGPLERHMRDSRAAAVMAPTTDLLLDFIGKAVTGQEVF
jgi:alkylation response protein AidB-like acyl-CoA dehydrogenase